jgi:16S rRNA (cytosine1402-N4)-methyltransferase
MRFSETTTLTAKDIISTYWEQKLKGILVRYGDFSEKTAEYLAKGILEATRTRAITTTQQLAYLLTTLRCNQKKIAVIFQVLRIETNAELQQLEQFLERFWDYLSTHGRCAIITYHSIEDRITKIAFKKLSESWAFTLINKKVIQPHYTEVMKNKAARSAKLRIIEKL